MKRTKFFTIAVLLVFMFSAVAIAAVINNPFTGGQFESGTKIKSELGYFDKIMIYTHAFIFGNVIFEGTDFDTYQTSLSVENPTADNDAKLPDYTGGVPLVVSQGYTQFSHGEATTVDVTGAGLTLPDGWFSEGKSFRVTAGGTVTGTNGAVTVALYLEDGAVCTLTTGTAAAGDWTAEFIITSTGDAAQRIIGTLIAGAGTDPISDYAADTTDITTAGTIPLKLQVGLANASDAITAEYWMFEHWSLTD